MPEHKLDTDVKRLLSNMFQFDLSLNQHAIAEIELVMFPLGIIAIKSQIYMELDCNFQTSKSKTLLQFTLKFQELFDVMILLKHIFVMVRLAGCVTHFCYTVPKPKYIFNRNYCSASSQELSPFLISPYKIRCSTSPQLYQSEIQVCVCINRCI